MRRMSTKLLCAGIPAVICGIVAVPIPGGAYAAPGVPEPGVVVYEEDFSSGSPSAGASPVELTDYTGGAPANNETYTADPAWLPSHNGCNGWILNNRSAPAPASDTGCPRDGGRDDAGNSRIAWYFHRYHAYVLGLAQGQENAEALTNNVLAFHSNGGTQSAGTVFDTAEDSTQALAGHCYMATLAASQIHCPAPGESWTSALLQIYLKVGGADDLVAADVTPCATGQTYTLTPPQAPGNPAVTAKVVQAVSVARLVDDATSLGLRVDNTQASYVGNDFAIDVPRIIDVTPQLDKSFSPATIEAGGTSTLTFTITNTSELAAKEGWSFVDTLPVGVRVASPANASTNCADGQVEANDTGTTITVNGGMEEGVESCEVTIDVTSTVPGEHTNTADNVDGMGVLDPGDATLVVNAPPAQSATIDLSKTLATPRVADTDQFTVAIREGAVDGPVVASATTTGTGSIVGSGWTGEVDAVPGTAYYLTESGKGSTSSENYKATVTCADEAGVQDGFPDNFPAESGVAITPVDGADISCVITNTALPALIPPHPAPPSGTALPVTGPGGIAWLLLSGAILVTAGTGAFVWTRRRGRELIET